MEGLTEIYYGIFLTVPVFIFSCFERRRRNHIITETAPGLIITSAYSK